MSPPAVAAMALLAPEVAVTATRMRQLLQNPRRLFTFFPFPNRPVKEPNLAVDVNFPDHMPPYE